MGETFRCRMVTWDEISRWSTQVARKIRSGGYAPDVIVGLTRGGWVTARLLCDLLGVKRLYAVKVEHWGVTAQPDGKAKLIQGLGADVAGSKVLLVDDITDTGESLQLARDHVKAAGPSELKSATLLHIAHSTFVPDYYEVRVEKEEWAWFIFPWNVHEDLRTIIPKSMGSSWAGVQEIRTALADGFQLNLDNETVAGALLELLDSGLVEKEGAKWRSVPVPSKKS